MVTKLLFCVYQYHIPSGEWRGRKRMLCRLQSHRSPFRCQHDGTDAGTPARRPNYCPTVPVLSRRLSRRPVVPSSFSMTPCVNDGNWTLRLWDILPNSHFTYDMDTSPTGQFAYETVRLL